VFISLGPISSIDLARRRSRSADIAAAMTSHRP
jgi:hypothetical protein